MIIKKILDIFLVFFCEINNYKNSLNKNFVNLCIIIDFIHKWIYTQSIISVGDIQNMEIKLQRLKDIYPKIAEYKGVLDLKDAKDNMLDEQYIFKLN